MDDDEAAAAEAFFFVCSLFSVGFLFQHVPFGVRFGGRQFFRRFETVESWRTRRGIRSGKFNFETALAVVFRWETMIRSIRRAQIV